MTGNSIILIGAGAIGGATALAMAEAGRDVVLIKRSEPCGGASLDNASLLGSTECVPMAAPGVLRNLPEWLIAQEGPLFLFPANLPAALLWLLRVAAQSTRARTEADSEALAALLKSSRSDTIAWLKTVGLPSHLSETETMRLYPTLAHLDADAYKLDLRRRHGARYQLLSAGDIKVLEPSISGDYEVGLLAQGAHYFGDPVDPILKSVRRLCELGGELLRENVSWLDMSGAKPVVILQSGKMLAADNVVVAAGIHSRRLAKTVGDQFPLKSERGYHIQFTGTDIGLSRGVVGTAEDLPPRPFRVGCMSEGWLNSLASMLRRIGVASKYSNKTHVFCLARN